MNAVRSAVLSQVMQTSSDVRINSNPDISSSSSSHKSSGESRHRQKKPHIIIDIVTPALSRLSSAQHERAMLVETSSIQFGNECLRLINIAFQTSQAFSSLMSTCNDISQYLRKELLKKYSGQYFHIIIGQNNAFGFAIDDDEYFAEVEQEQYRVLIFTASLDKKVNLERHDANSLMILQWKSLVGKQSKK